MLLVVDQSPLWCTTRSPSTGCRGNLNAWMRNGRLGWPCRKSEGRISDGCSDSRRLLLVYYRASLRHDTKYNAAVEKIVPRGSQVEEGCANRSLWNASCILRVKADGIRCSGVVKLILPFRHVMQTPTIFTFKCKASSKWWFRCPFGRFPGSLMSRPTLQTVPLLARGKRLYHHARTEGQLVER